MHPYLRQFGPYKYYYINRVSHTSDLRRSARIINDINVQTSMKPVNRLNTKHAFQ